MSSNRKIRRKVSIGAEFLESRHLLNAHVPHQPTVHVQATPKPPKPPKAPHEIAGTLTGLTVFTTNPDNANQGYDTYSASAPAKGGVATYYGTDSYTSVQVNPKTFNDTYFNGFSVLYLAGGNQVSINYVGKGPYPASNTGPYSAKLKGEAIGITGSLTGHEYAFTATLTGDAASANFKLKFTLKG